MRITRKAPRTMTVAIALWMAVLPVGTAALRAAEATGRPSDAQAMQRYIKERLESLSTQEDRMVAELRLIENGHEAGPGRIASPERAEYLRRMIEDNRVLAARYQARLEGRPDPHGPASKASRARGGEGEKKSGLLGGLLGGGGMGGIMELMTGDMNDPVSMVVSMVAGLGGFYIGRRYGGFIGGMVGGMVMPMLANFIMKQLKGKKDEGTEGPREDWLPPALHTRPDLGIARNDANTTKQSQESPALGGEVAQIKANMDRAYAALRAALQEGRPAGEISPLRQEYSRWQHRYSQAVALAR